GGESGKVIVPGAPDRSLLIEAVRYENNDLQMPPKYKLKPAEIEALARWVKLGAPDPRRGKASPLRGSGVDVEKGRQFWSFVPPRRRAPPAVRDAGWPRSDIDRFILAALEKRGLVPVADGDRTVKIRRLYLDLIGLPPTPTQLEAFLADRSPQAWANAVDRLLESPHFGERWGRHWLDVARFAESSGGGRSLMFKNAWRYRDYVIDSYNSDKPFDKFIREQLAGDLLPYESPQQRTEQLTATGFLALGPTNYELQDKELLRMEVIDEQIDTMGRAFLGMTLGCARCHDHKFDPIPTSDYYALAGIFGSTKSIKPGNVSNYIEQPLPRTNTERMAKQKYDEKVKALTARLAAANAELKRLGGRPEVVSARKPVGAKSRPLAALRGMVIDETSAELTGKWTKSVFNAYFVNENYIHDSGQPKGANRAVFTPKIREGGMYEVRLSYAPGSNRATNTRVTIDHQDGQAAVTVNQAKDPPIDGLYISLGRYRFEADTKSAVTITNKGADGVVIVDSVQFLSDAAVSQSPPQPPATNESASKKSPANEAGQTKAIRAATARVKKLDGQLKAIKKKAPKPGAVAMSVMDEDKPADGHIHIRGVVRNLGPRVSRGFITVAMPSGASAPKIETGRSGRIELADWIASQDNPLTARVYVNRIWRHLLGVGIVPTPDNHGETGRRPSHPELLDYLANQFIADGWSTKKLIRRIALSRAYQLSTEYDSGNAAMDAENRLLWRFNRRRLDVEVIRDSVLFSSGKLDLTGGGLTIRKFSTYDLGYTFDTVRRSVYVPAFRNSLLEIFEVFDFANPNLVIGDRNTSTLPTQSLYMMNSPFVIEQSRHTARRLLDDTALSEAARIDLAYGRILCRKPTSNERRLAMKYLSEFRPDDPKIDDKLEAWASFCHSLFASLDFRYMN
ncbi:MAG: DUF1553 domain-containing protein, partial [Planctomycetota bacterium]|nr:DUF1553 domain-containing protein [Planctomycetota bacterium]